MIMRRLIFNYRKVVILLIVLLFLLSFNKAETQETIRKIDLTGNLNNTRNLLLSEIASEITYVKLETNGDCHISKMASYFVGNKYIGIHDRDLDCLYLFDSNGKFLRKIGIKGPGPGEYASIASFSMDENESHLLTRLPTSAYGNGYINDIDGGVCFFPGLYKNNKLYKFLESDRVIQLRTQGHLPYLNAKDQKSKEIFENLIKELDLNDNPVLMIVSLK
jgi:hypothetical protein